MDNEITFISKGQLQESRQNSGTLMLTFGANNILPFKQQQQVLAAFKGEAYEMAAEFVWKKTITRLKDYLGKLGKDFIADLTKRGDDDSTEDIDSLLSDYKTIKLSEQLGMINHKASMKLMQALDNLQYVFSSVNNDEDNELKDYEAYTIISDCIFYVLDEPRLEIDIEFTKLRDRLMSSDIKEGDVQIAQLKSASLFFIRTVYTVLTTAIRKEKGVVLDHAVNNLKVLLPLIWERLTKEDRWKIGRLYRDVATDGMVTAAAGVKSALSLVKGFDYVPEDLRSNTFIAHAQNVIDTHFSMYNFYNEPQAVKDLAQLGEVIPDPAFPECINAYLLVYVGNFYGPSFDAQDTVKEQLKGITDNRWEEFYNSILPYSEDLLRELTSSNPMQRMKTLQLSIAQSFNLQENLHGKGRILFTIIQNTDCKMMKNYVKELAKDNS